MTSPRGPYRIIDRPFFILEYSKGTFIRKLPKGVRDLGGGFFREGDTVWRLPGAEGHPLAEKIIRGRALLSLLRSGDYVLAVSPPLPAENEDRLTELALVPGAGGIPRGRENGERDVPLEPVYIEIREDGDPASWLPLEDLPCHRYCRGFVHEIMDGKTMDELLAAWGVPAGTGPRNAGDISPDGKTVRGRLVLRGEDIPRFFDARRDLVRRFGDAKLRGYFSEESLFVPPRSLSFVYTAEQAPLREETEVPDAGVRAFPSLKYGGRRYRAPEVSALMEREYVLLDDRWARREDLEEAGLLPLGYYAGGIPLASFKPGPADIIFREGNGPAGFLPFEWKTELWKSGRKTDGSFQATDVFRAHVAFLRFFGFSGGAVIRGRREQAECLASLVADLSNETGTALVLADRACYELYLQKLPAFKNAPSRITMAFYGDPAGNPRGFDLVVLLEPEDPPDEALYTLSARQPPALNAPVVLGIFSDPFEASGGKGGGMRLKSGIRNMLGIRDERLDKYLVRRMNVPLPLPEPAGKQRGEKEAETGGRRRTILRPPRPPENCPLDASPERRGIVLFSDRVKFKKLPAADLLTELSRINDTGEKSPYVPLRSFRRDPSFDSLNGEQARYFFYWRGEVRRRGKTGGPLPAAGEDYIRLYARELILAMGGGEGIAAFRELLELWTGYRGDFPGMDGYFPAWLLDFAALYEIEGDALPLLLPLVPSINAENTEGGGGVPGILADLHIHSRFIDGNNAVRFEDIRILTGEAPEEIVQVLNAVDRFLRENFRLRFFTFFYPPGSHREKRDAFDGLGGAGSSSYTAEWISFSRHRPLLEFLETLKNHLEFRLGIKAGINRKPLAEPWKSIAEGALGGVLQPRVIPIARQHVRPERLERLRKESEEIRELLAPPVTGPPRGEDPPAEIPPFTVIPPFSVIPQFTESSGAEQKTPPVRPPPAEPPTPEPGEARPDLGRFFSALSETERTALSILRGGNRADFWAFARRNGIMPDLLIDGINARFGDLFGDLLVNVMDEGPEIQAEYREELDRLFKTETERHERYSKTDKHGNT
ncbi:MAG: TerB N-terminal domain-containing protein [Treponema sp.]|nr:TerB N-terminal domain-containing protein [Treponema sp.]